MRVTCERCLRRYDVPDATVKGRKIRARCKCGARVVVQDEERAAKSLAAGSQTTGSIQRPVRWFVDITSWEPIAMDMRQLVRAFDAGRVDADTLVWRKGMPDWRRLRDISELAERLVGSGDSSEKTSSEQPAADFAQSSSEPPPRQSERSRTPPASYTVGARSGSEPPPAIASDGAGISGAMSQSAAATPAAATQVAPARGASSVPPAPDESVATDRASVAPPAESRGSTPPSRRSTPSGSPRARRGRGKTPSRPNASLTPVPSRTVTQTGLESPAEVTARNSILPPAGSLGSSSEGSGRTRDSRTSVAPGGTRRQSSSDETPAQKPSSLSVPPGALLGSSSKPRGRRFIALAAVVLGGAILLVKQVATSGESTAVTADHRVDAVHEPKRIEKSLAPDRKAAAGQPTPQDTAPALEALNSLPSTAREPRSQSNVAAGSAAAPGSPGSSGSASAASHATSSAAPGESTAPSAPLNVEASAKETVGGPAGVVPAAAAAREVTSAPPPAAKPPVASAPTAPPPPRPAAAPVPKQLPAPARPPAAAPAEPAPAVAREPRPFDETLATQQFQSAASKASDCAQQGTTRGTGRVKVAIEPWGRVGRVTHLNQDFVGTPVGLCVMQAFQEIRVAPFDGNSRSIAGEFVIE